MPSGYLKNERGISARARRGGGSYRPPKPTKTASLDPSISSRSSSPRSSSQKKGKCARLLVDEQDIVDFDYDDSCFDTHSGNKQVNTTQTKKLATTQEGECPICLSVGPVHELFANCKHSACYTCLREFYIVQAQSDVSNYPLSCFDLSCDRLLQDNQIKQLVRSDEEMDRHRQLGVLAKANRRGLEKCKVVHCPDCDFPRQVRRLADNNVRVFPCRKCGKRYLINEILSIVENLPDDEMGDNQGWAKCPHCRVIISKGHGCDHMVCGLCRNHFSWSKAREKARQRPPRIGKNASSLEWAT